MKHGNQSLLKVDESNSQEGYLTSKEAANYLNVAVKTLYNQKCNGVLGGYKFGKFLYFKQRELDELIERGRF
ncbi:helix-turn-helix domain-containing protein [uncultured Acetobacteroides sp.]|uniref:helix-turn-helix domain-containing protein n=1 Tax=uncultured Acetobacteroides sp. TaxID=1760811 RepID=UPI0029F51BDB|nr:helix-turn-helix domain-containing protein [uncultured Acetobacteroides sp.]